MMMNTPVMAFVVACAAVPALAQNQASDLSHIVQFELLDGWRQDDGTHMMAVRVHLEEGWNTYWRVGGNSGIPPRFTFDGSSNVESAEIQWPRPVVFDLHGSRVIGYLNDLVLPVVVRPARPDAGIQLNATLDLGVCSEICIPVTATFEAVLPANGGSGDADIQTALATVPGAMNDGVKVGATCRFDPVKNGVHLQATIATPKLAQGEEVAVIEFPNPNIWIALPEVSRQDAQLTLSVDMINYGGGDFKPDPADIRITILGEDHALDIQGCVLTSG